MSNNYFASTRGLPLQIIAVVVVAIVALITWINDVDPLYGTGTPLTRVFRLQPDAKAELIKFGYVNPYDVIKEEYKPNDNEELLLKITIDGKFDYYAHYNQTERDYSALKTKMIDNSSNQVYAVFRGLPYDRDHDELFFCPTDRFDKNCMLVESAITTNNFNRTLLFNN